LGVDLAASLCNKAPESTTEKLARVPEPSTNRSLEESAVSKKSEELLAEVDESRRSLLRKILTAGAAVYVAPVIASFALSKSFTGVAQAHGGNQDFLCHPILGSNQYGRTVFPTSWHMAHGDGPAPGATHWGQLCDPDD
jgi:hypothetical protein